MSQVEQGVNALKTSLEQSLEKEKIARQECEQLACQLKNTASTHDLEVQLKASLEQIEFGNRRVQELQKALETVESSSSLYVILNLTYRILLMLIN